MAMGGPDDRNNEITYRRVIGFRVQFTPALGPHGNPWNGFRSLPRARLR